MARDHALALRLREREGVLRFYQWARPTVSFGRNEPAKGRYALGLAEEEGVEFVRRPTGGRAVLHDRELTYALVFPAGALGGLKRSYRLINEGLVRGLRRLGAPVETAKRGVESLPPDAGPCFRTPAAGEVVAAERKLIGSAQVRIGRAVLQHGSLMLDGDQDLLRRLRGEEGPGSRPATLSSLLGSIPPLETLASVLREGLALALGGEWAEGVMRPDEELASAELETHYRDSEWTWHR